MDVRPATSTDIAAVLEQMRALRAAAGRELAADMAVPDRSPAAAEVSDADFSALLRSAVDSVARLQNESSSMSKAFVRGESDDLVSVMVAAQKSSVAFQALTQVRNRVVSAYQDIMNMPI